jgi:TatA/E family protein of Tat protein translocase
MFGLGAGELLLIFGVAILFFGPKKLPELARGLGQSINEFKKGKDGSGDDEKKV